MRPTEADTSRAERRESSSTLALRSYAFERLSAIAAVLDDSGTIVDTNEAWRLFCELNEGSTGSTGVGVNYLEVCDRAARAGSSDAAIVASGLRQILSGERTGFDYDYPCSSENEDSWFMMSAAAAPVSDGAGVVLFHVDITARRALEQRLVAAADLDELTGLANRRATVRFIGERLEHARVTGEPLWVMFLDLDGFKNVNDCHGHHVGDELLVKVASRARRVLRADDLLSRFGGDEFVVVCPGMSAEDAESVAARLHAVMVQPFQIGATQVSIEASIGVVRSSHDSTIDSLLSSADAQMYRQKDRKVARPTRRPDRNVWWPMDRASAVGTERPPRRRRLLSELQAAMTTTEAVLAQSNDVVMFFAPDGTITWVSPASRRLFGMEPEQLVGANGLALIHPDDQDRVFADFARIPNLGDHVRTEFRVHDQEGRLRWVEEIATNLLDDPNVGVIVGHLREITDRKRVEEQLRLQSSILAAAGQAIVAMDTAGTVIYWNRSAERTYGWSEREAIGRSVIEMLPAAPGWHGQVAAARAAMRAGQVWSGRLRLCKKNGDEVPVRATYTPVLDDRHAQVATIGVSDDITEELLSQELAARLSAIVESSDDAVFSQYLDGTITSWNAGAASLYGYAQEAILGRTVEMLAPVRRPTELIDTLGQVRRSGSPQRIQTIGRRASGEEFHAAIVVSPMRDDDGTVIGTSMIARDVTDRVEMMVQIADDRRRLAEAQASAHLGNWEFDTATGDMVRSDELLRIVGRSPGEISGVDFEHIHVDDRAEVGRLFADVIAGRRDTVEHTHRVVRPDGEVRWVVSRSTRDQAPSSRTISGTMLDITERYLAERKLAHQASHDLLTGLPNRAGLTQLLDTHLAAAASGRCVAVALVDLDQFKVINDTLGHETGDLALLAVAEQLRQGLPATDMVGRFGGDEFVLIRPDVAGCADARELGDAAARVLSTPVVVAGQQFALTASIGVTLSSDADTPESLIRDADAAMYQAKQDGRAQVVVFEGPARLRARRQLKIEAELRGALQTQQFHLVFQPVLDLATFEAVGFETLLRWDHPELGAVGPAEFIPIAERSGLIIPIGEWVLREALRQLAQWRTHARVRADLWLAVNVSAAQLGQPDAVRTIVAAIHEAGIPTELVHLEITESVLIDRIDQVIEAMTTFRALGVHISLDDFGTGYSSLSYLNRLPINTVKIDKSFVQGLGENGHDTTIVRTILALADTLKLTVIAEGIEDDPQLQLLRDLGCAFGQGFLWSRPLRADDAFAWLLRFGGSHG